MSEEVETQFRRILRELPHHPAARRFCFAGWDWDDYCRLAHRLLHCGIPLLVYVLPDTSLLVGPPGPLQELRLRMPG